MAALQVSLASLGQAWPELVTDRVGGVTRRFAIRHRPHAPQQCADFRLVNAQRRRRVPSFLAVVQMHAAAGRRSYVTAAMRSPRPPAMVMDTFSCIETCVLLHRDMRAGGTRCGHRTPTAG